VIAPQAVCKNEISYYRATHCDQTFTPYFPGEGPEEVPAEVKPTFRERFESGRLAFNPDTIRDC
jgi:hypothetical protein